MSRIKSKKGQKSENLQQVNLLQAVVVADSFDSRFQPISDDLPRSLFPLVNRPLLAYTLEFLAASGVTQIYVYCCHLSAQVKEYLATSKWSSETSQCKVTPLFSNDFTSLGDVLRDIDQKSLFESDFLLVAGDVVSNMSLTKALDEHKQRREKDKNGPLMTLLLRTCPPAHTAKSSEDDIIVALSSMTNQVMFYQKIGESKLSKINFPVKSLLESQCTEFDLRYDLMDTYVAVCSPQVPQLFTDNFDYQTREDFIRGILINEEFLGNQFHVHIVQNEFAARVSNLHMYDVVSRAVISRWVYPFVPDNDFDRSTEIFCKKSTKEMKDSTLYCHLRHNVYLGQLKSIGKGSLLEDNSAVGHGAIIGNGCRITNSVVGCDCIIGDGVIIEDAYLWNGVTVKNNCKIKKSLLCEDVVVHENCILSSGCILTSKVEVGPNVTVKEETVMVAKREDDDDAFASCDTKTSQIENTYDKTVVGIKGRGFLWSSKQEDGSDDEMEEMSCGIWGMSLLRRDNARTESEGTESSEESDVLSQESDVADYRSDEEDNVIKTVFYKEVNESITGAIEENISCDNLILEVNSSKYANNVSINDVMRCITLSAFEISTGDETSYFASLKKILMYLIPIFLNYNKSSHAQLECIYEMEKFCLKNKHASDCLIKILMLLYEEDVLAEQVILHWHNKPQAVDTSLLLHTTPEELRKSVTKFIDWLREAEEESSDDNE